MLKYNVANNEWGVNTILAIMGYFGVLGFLMLYFWSKTDYSSILDGTDKIINALKATKQELKNVTSQKEQAEQEKEQAQQAEKNTKSDFEKSQKTTAAMLTHEKVSNSQNISDDQLIEQLQNRDGEKMAGQLEQLKQKVKEVLSLKTITVSDDLQKNRWGGKKENNGMAITAQVKANDWQELFDVTVKVARTDRTALDKPVAIFLHDTYRFPDNVVYVTPVNGIVELSLLAYEAFTIGAMLNDGTELELDLNEEEGLPKGFYWQHTS